MTQDPNSPDPRRLKNVTIEQMQKMGLSEYASTFLMRHIESLEAEIAALKKGHKAEPVQDCPQWLCG